MQKAKMGKNEFVMEWFKSRIGNPMLVEKTEDDGERTLIPRDIKASHCGLYDAYIDGEWWAVDICNCGAEGCVGWQMLPVELIQRRRFERYADRHSHIGKANGSL